MLENIWRKRNPVRRESAAGVGLIVLTLVLAALGSGLFLAWPRLFPGLVARGTVAYERGN